MPPELPDQDCSRNLKRFDLGLLDLLVR